MKVLSLMFLFILSACGMQGDLYLPEEDHKEESDKSTSEDLNQGLSAETGNV